MGVMSGMTNSSPNTCRGLSGAVGGRKCRSEFFSAPVGEFLEHNTGYGMLICGRS